MESVMETIKVDFGTKCLGKIVNVWELNQTKLLYNDYKDKIGFPKVL